MVDIIGTSGRDTLHGSASADRIWGRADNDLLYGYAGNDTLFGEGGNDTLDGGTGADSMNGGDGNDVYYVDNAGDVAAESYNDALGGVDLVYASVSHALGFGIENLTLTGLAHINGTGNANANVITGNGGNNRLLGLGGNDTLRGGAGRDTLDGGTGADSMNGGDGDDVYFVDNAGDVAVETFNDALGGVDLVYASVSHALGFGIENLTLTGLAHINGTGNANANVITGNAGNNRLSGLGGNDTLRGGAGTDTLDGGTGADSMDGGDGNDVYYVDNAGDVAAETYNDVPGGVDLVYASVSHTLGYGIENLTLTGSAHINGAGNANGNVITGNAGNNRLSGLYGSDTIYGGSGNDTLYGDYDTDLADIAPGNDWLDGGSGHDLLDGGHLSDRLFGGAGNDTLIGGTGADTLTGGADNDRFVYQFVSDSNAINGVDLIQGFDRPGAGDSDRIDLSGIDADLTTPGNQTFRWGQDNSSPLTQDLKGVGYVWLETEGTTTVLYGRTGSSSNPNFRVVIADGAVSEYDYTRDDFIL